MIRFYAVLFIAIMVFFAAGFALQTIRVAHNAVLWEEIATQVELNRMQLKRLQQGLDQLEQQVGFVSKTLRIHYEYFDACPTAFSLEIDSPLHLYTEYTKNILSSDHHLTASEFI
jgi:hypothetical protein